MGKSWEEMVQDVVINGRPGDVASAALGWKELLKNLGDVKQSLEKNVTDLGATWKGPAYESFKTHIEQIAKDIGRAIDDANKGDGIVTSLNTAVSYLTQAQQNMPIPAAAFNDVLEARNGKIHLQIGLFEAKVKPDFLGLLDPLTSLYDWIFDKTEEARKVYKQVDDNYQGKAHRMPGEVRIGMTERPDLQKPDLDVGPGTIKPSVVPPTDGRLPSDLGKTDVGPMSIGDPPELGRGPGNDFTGSSITGSDYGYSGPGAGYPGGGSVADLEERGTGLAGAGPGLGGAGAGGLPGLGGVGGGAGLGTGGLGAAGAGGAGAVPGGGALGRPVTPGMMPGMMGGAGAGAGRGQSGGRRGGGALSGGGPGGGAVRGGAGGMAGGRGMAAMGGMGGMGGGPGAEGHDRNSWLHEDEDVWGAEGDAPPGVLR